MSQQYVTSIGLDVHARSISAFAFNPMTGECERARFAYDPSAVADWASGFESPRAVYESGVTGFHLCRALRSLGLDCVVGAVSKMQRPSADRRRKTDRRDAEFLARLLATRNVTEVHVPDEETEAARDLYRALEDARDDLSRAKQRLSKFLMRHGHVFDERTPGGRRKTAWGSAFWAWVSRISFDEADDAAVLRHYVDRVRSAEAARRGLVDKVVEAAGRERWKPTCDALRRIKGIETPTAFCLAAEAGDFSRFRSADAFSAWCGLVPSEHSSGEGVSRGGITKTGNRHVRSALVEAAWHVPMSNGWPKRPSPGQEVPDEVRRHAEKGNRRLRERRDAMSAAGKGACVANCATAREMACWVWALARMVG